MRANYPVKLKKIIKHILYFVALIPLNIVIGYGQSSYVAGLPDLGEQKAGDQSQFEAGSEIQDVYQQAHQQFKEQTLQEGGSYQQPWGALKDISPTNTEQTSKKEDKVTNEPNKPSSDSVAVNQVNAMISQMGLNYKDIYDQTFSKNSDDIKSVIAKSEIKPAIPVLSQVSSSPIAQTASEDNLDQSINIHHSDSGRQKNHTKQKAVQGDRSSNQPVMDISSIHRAQREVLPGYTYFAVLKNEINSDYPGPVTASIVNGNLHGAKLLGSFERQTDVVKIIFNQMVYQQQLYSIHAIAVDPEKYRTALADDVDHHYAERYGLFFIASFGKGYADALQTGSTVSNSGGVVSTKDKLSPSEKLEYALGETGNQFLPTLRDQINRPPTVTVNQGQGVGIMFLESVKLQPNNSPSDTPEWLSEMRGQ
jgi:intracellular multiplication protein IcmE